MDAPKLRFKDFNQKWSLSTIKEITIGLEYGMNSSAKAFDGENQYIRITDIDENSRRYIVENRVSPDGVLSSNYLLEEGDILFARTGASTGKSYLYKLTDGKMYFAGFLIRARLNKEVVSKFVYLQTLTKRFNHWVKIMSMRSGQPGINAKEYGEYNIQVTTYDEQQKIADFFTQLDQRLEKQREKVNLLQARKKGLMQKIFAQELRFKDEHGQNYPAWRMRVKAKDLFQSVSDKSHDGTLEVLSATQDKGILPRSLIDRKMQFASNNLVNYKRVRVNEYIISLRSFEGGIETSSYDGLVSPAYTVFKIINPEQVEVGYFKCFFKTTNFITRLNNLTYGIRDGKSISYTDFSEMQFNIPSKEEQIKIVNFLSKIDNKVKIEKTKLIFLKEQKQAFMQQMFI